MSLTRCLKDPRSPLSRFLAAELPAVATLARVYRSRLPLDPETVTPHGTAPFSYRSLGQAIDLRLRIAFGTPVGAPLQAGVDLAVGDTAYLASIPIADAVQEAGDSLLAELRTHPAATPGAMLLDPVAEERLARLCFVAAWFEEVFRQGMRDGNPLLQAPPGQGLEGLLALVPDYVPGDLGGQAALADRPDTLQWILNLPVSGRVCGPVFGGSGHVGGADADFIAAGHLIDCKSTIRPRRMGRPELYQLAGYLLLDYDNAYGIEQVSLYLARQGRLIGWSPEKFLQLLGARRSLSELREVCQQALGAPAETASTLLPRQAVCEQEALFGEA
ncbi:hypothetical protein [Streptomyces sp. NBC_00859]|uniref:hypothetical protein n=1 Tax=Streptomyces sp. NBC_00859 TaxID=2903682 RepID=UPI003868C95D|nr:hypothetical protein OG584_00175 [Streptomyces sp. NBC_00859]WSZ86762.1 hypothetical protein OG584_34965 [Streptomyces sp. NBC_00859]